MTHALLGVGAARLICPKRALRPQCALAGAVGGILMDADSFIYWIHADWYGFYHRVLTHSIIGLACSSALSALAVWSVMRWRCCRRFGWFVDDTLGPETSIPRASWALLLGIASIAAATHWTGDLMTGYGNLTPFWPWSQRELSLHIITSFDWFVFSATLIWHVTIRSLEWPRGREVYITGIYLLILAVYLAARSHFGSPTVW